MEKFYVDMTVSNAELEKVLSELRDATEKISQCYYRLRELGFVTIHKNEDTASGN